MESEHRQARRTSDQRGGCAAIVDDDPVCVVTLEEAFGRQGLRTINFADGAEAQQEILACPDVLMVIANWMLPGKDGHVTCRELAEQRPDLTTVLMLGRRYAADAWRKMKLRADYVLAKPFLASSVDEQVRILIEMARGRSVSSDRRLCHETTDAHAVEIPAWRPIGRSAHMRSVGIGTIAM